MVQLRSLLRQPGLLTDDGDSLLLTQDYTFASPSTAAAVMLGRNANGRPEWRDAAGQTLRDIQKAAVGAS